MRISSTGAIKFNDYGAGTLVSDASGNITVSSGGGVGGPFLPLAGGTMTGTSGIEFPDSFKLKWKSVAHSTEVFSITSTGDTNSIVSGDGTNSVKTKIFVGDGGLDINSNDPVGSIADFDYGGISLMQSNVVQFSTTSSGISVKGGDKGQPGYTFIGDTNTGMYSDTADQLDFAVGGDTNLSISNGYLDITQYIRHIADTNTYFGFVSSDNFIVVTSGAEIMRVNSSGNVGIDTSGS
jgi:hypothetical protein